MPGEPAEKTTRATAEPAGAVSAEALQVWCWHALAKVNPAIRSGQLDPFASFSARLEEQSEDYFQQLRSFSEAVPDRLAELRAGFDALEAPWQDFQALPWVVPIFVPIDMAKPAALSRCRRLLERLDDAICEAERLFDEDPRDPSWSARLAHLHGAIIQLTEEHCAVAGALAEREELLVQLHRHAGRRLLHLETAARACDEPDPRDVRKPFETLQAAIQDLFDFLSSCDAKGRGAWQQLSEASWSAVRDKGGVALEPTPDDLDVLLEAVSQCIAEESEALALMQTLRADGRLANLSTGMILDCERFSSWLAQLPKAGPRSNRVRRMWARFAWTEDQPRSVLAACPHSVPKWLREIRPKAGPR